ncbi:elongation factor G, partial [Desulfovibrio desulfuricans]|nr:elongation factor G [Desulfovibrio desulfuricans]
LLARLDDDTGSRMVSGMGELHLDVLLARMHREYGISPRAGNPQVVLRETVRKEAEAAAVFDREMGKERHQGSAALRVAPRARGTGNVVEGGDFFTQ